MIFFLELIFLFYIRLRPFSVDRNNESDSFFQVYLLPEMIGCVNEPRYFRIYDYDVYRVIVVMSISMQNDK